jgi:hypothetical protein
MKKLNENLLKEVTERSPKLLKTIVFPKRIHYLTGRLPEANYKRLQTIKIDKKQYLATLSGNYPANKDSGIRHSMQQEPHYKQSNKSKKSKNFHNGSPNRLP